jgi:hypothetical protein
VIKDVNVNAMHIATIATSPATIAKTACSLCTKKFGFEDLHRCPHCKGMICDDCGYECLCSPRTKFLRAIAGRSLYVMALMEEVAELNAAALLKPLKKAQLQRLKAITATIDSSKKVLSLCAKLAA